MPSPGLILLAILVLPWELTLFLALVYFVVWNIHWHQSERFMKQLAETEPLFYNPDGTLREDRYRPPV